MSAEGPKSIKLLAMDVDGVLTRGDVIFSDDGEEIKVFNIQDGLGIAVAKHGGLATAIISGRASSAVQRRATELGVTYVRQGCRDKGAAIRELLEETGLKRNEIAFIGDDINDLLAFSECSWKVATANACKDIKAHADHMTERSGGDGAVREVIELILETQGKWKTAVEEYLHHLEQSGCQT